MNPSSLDPLIGAIYDAVTTVDGFQHFVNGLSNVFGLKAAMLFTTNMLNGEVKGMWHRGMEQRWMESYAITYGNEDQLARLLATSQMASFYASNLHLSADEYTNSRFYREWVIPQGVQYAAGAVVLREGVWATQVVIQRSPTQPPFSAIELAMLDQLVPHLQRAVQMRHRFLELQLGQTLSTTGLEIIGMPAIVLDEWGCVVCTNQSAKRLFETRNGVWIQDRHLHTSDLAVTKQINLEVLVAIGASRGNIRPVPGVVNIPRLQHLPLTLMVVPMGVAESEARGTVLAFIYDPANTPRATPALVERLFSLTIAEAELVVALCDGNTLEEAALARQTSIHTVRSQLKSIFSKTGTHRQTELLALVLLSPAYFLAKH
jgi:DNA-binding CsgD family transcriptional regulator